MNIPDYLDLLLKKIWGESKPVSIFLYGSMARDDFEKDSDYEIGIVYKEEKKWSRQKLAELNIYNNVKVYPFVCEELQKGEIDTPFPKAIYLQGLVNSGVVLYGKELKNIIKCPKITKDDLIEQVAFCLGRAYSSVVSSRQKDWVSVRDSFTKSALYGLQVLVFIKTGKMIYSYTEIDELSRKYIDDEYIELINHVIKIRKGDEVVQSPLLYKNISFLNKVVLKAAKE